MERLPHKVGEPSRVMDRKQPVPVPPAYRGREQTLVKHILLRDYLERVAWNILSFKSDFVFVDGFSGPWKHVSDDYSDTSFGIAIEKLRKVKAGFAAKGERKSLRCVFVEKRTAAFLKLTEAAASASDLDAKALPGTFEDQVDDVLRIVGRGFALTFVDPTGWSFDLKKLAPLLSISQGKSSSTSCTSTSSASLTTSAPRSSGPKHCPSGTLIGVPTMTL